MPTSQTELITGDARLAPASPMPVAEMLQAMIQQGVTQENMGALEKMVDLYERMQDRDAERQFNAAFVKLQSELPVIVASTVIQNRGKYERFEDVMRVVAPVLAQNGFSVSFSMENKDGRVMETCNLRHIAGHSQSNSFTVRTGKADTDTQADCKAATTAKRNALLNALNIVIRQDVYQNEEGDASLEGPPINRDQIQYLTELSKDTGTIEATILKMANAASIAEIRTGPYHVIVRGLNMKAKR